MLAMIASELMEYLVKDKNVVRVDPLGSLRRQASTIGDIDLSVATDDPVEVLEYFIKYPKSDKTIEKGEHTASILLPGGIQVDLMVQSAESLRITSSAFYRFKTPQYCPTRICS